MFRLVRAERKATVTQITTLNNCGEQKSISECTTRRTLRFHFCQLRTEAAMGTDSSKLTKTVEDWKNVVWSDDSRFLLWHTDGRARIWCQQHESINPTCLVAVV